MVVPARDPLPARCRGQVALVTGGGHGIGRAAALRLAAEGAFVAVSDLDLDAASRVRDEITATGAGAVAVGADVGDRAAVQAMVTATVEAFGGLDTLVCTAGGDRPLPDFVELSDDDWASLLDLNLTSVVRCCQAALPELSRPGRTHPSVVVVGSVNGLTALGLEPYSTAKAGLVSLVANLAVAWGPLGIRANLVAPGTIRTRAWANQPGGADQMRDLYPLGRVGEPEDVAAAIAFLASTDAAWVTGVTLPVDGGLLAGPNRRR